MPKYSASCVDFLFFFFSRHLCLDISVRVLHHFHKWVRRDSQLLIFAVLAHPKPTAVVLDPLQRNPLKKKNNHVVNRQIFKPEAFFCERPVLFSIPTTRTCIIPYIITLYELNHDERRTITCDTKQHDKYAVAILINRIVHLFSNKINTLLQNNVRNLYSL